jgi:hypothetical protein
LVLLEAGVENLLVEKRGRLRFEEDAGSLFVDHLVILGGQCNDAEVKFACVPARSATIRRPLVSEASSEDETMLFTASTALSVSASSALTSFLVGSGRSRPG